MNRILSKVFIVYHIYIRKSLLKSKKNESLLKEWSEVMKIECLQKCGAENVLGKREKPICIWETWCCIFVAIGSGLYTMKTFDKIKCWIQTSTFPKLTVQSQKSMKNV